MRRRWAVVLLVAIVTLGMAVRSYRLGARTLWFDEAYTWHLSRFPVPEMLARIAQDNSPPLYFLMLHGWMNIFGQSVVALRSMSVILSAVSIVGTYLLCTELFRSRQDGIARARRIGLAAALFVAANSFQIVYAWEARMYALGTALAALSSWTLIAALFRRRHGFAWWALYVVFAAGLLYSHYYGMFTLAAQGLYVLIVLARAPDWEEDPRRRRRVLCCALGAAAAVAVCFLPWLPAFWEQHSHVKAEYWTGPIGVWAIPNTFFRMIYPTDRPVLHYGRSALAVVLFLGALLVLARKCREQAPLFACAAGLPFLAATAITCFDVAVFSYRYFLFTALFVLAASAAAVMQFPSASLRRIGLVTATLGMLAAHATLLQQWNIEGHCGTRRAVAWIAQQAGPDDAVITGSPLLLFTANYYLPERLPCRLLETTPTRHYEGGPGMVPELYADKDALNALPDGARQSEGRESAASQSLEKFTAHSPRRPVSRSSLLKKGNRHLASTPTAGGNEAGSEPVPLFQQTGSPRLWVLDTDGAWWRGRDTPAPIGERWQLASRQIFPELYGFQGNVILREYRREGVQYTRRNGDAGEPDQVPSG